MHALYVLADVFTDRPFGGNALAVFPDAGEIPPALMPLLARELNLSETVFVLPAANAAHTGRLRIFTPAMELPFAGHPTVGAACVLAWLGRIRGGTAVFEEDVGPIHVRVRRAHDALAAAFSVAKLPETGEHAPDAHAVAALLGIEPWAIRDGDRAPRALSAGVPFLFVEVASVEALERVRLDLPRWNDLLAGAWAPHVYAFTHTDDGIRARMFAPAMGIVEDPATGAAAAALAGLLAPRDDRRDARLHWTIRQGIEIGRPSRIELEAEKRDGELIAVRVGGRTVVVGEGEFELDPATVGA